MDIDSLCLVGGKTIAKIEGEFGGGLDAVREEPKITLLFTDGTKLNLIAKIIDGKAMMSDN